MKQNITIKQLNELSEKGKEQLKEWWKPVEGDWYVDTEDSDILRHIDCCEDDVNDIAAFPLLSIGQMIEFLDEQGRDWAEGIVYESSDEVGYDYEIIVLDYQVGTLCDDLWQAVKEELER